jgi:hypothetical protein
MSSLPPNGTYKIESTGSGTGNKFLARIGDTVLLTTDSDALNIRVWSDSIGILPISYNVLIVDS